MKSQKKILFISHAATMTGAPILALNLLKKIREQYPNFTIHVLLLQYGDLYHDFAKFSDKILIANNDIRNDSFLKRNLKRLKSIIFVQKKETEQDKIDKITNGLLQDNYDLVFGNTIVTLSWTIPFFKKNIPTIVAIHELSFVIETFCPREFVKQNINNISQIIAGSQAVADNLVSRYGASETIVNVVHSFINDNITLHKNNDVIKKELNLNDNQLIIGIASAQELRKGTDLVPMLVKSIRQKTDIDFKFLNIGITFRNTEVMTSQLDAEKMGVLENIIYLEHHKNINDFINIFDIFLLTSREDPFPLVMLSAAKLKKPIVAFEKSGGATEFLEDGNGVLVPYLDINKMAEEIVKLMQDKNLRDNLGEKIYNKLENNYSENKLTQKIFDIIEKEIKL